MSEKDKKVSKGILSGCLGCFGLIVLLGIIIGACSAGGGDQSSKEKAITTETTAKKEETKKDKQSLDYNKVTEDNVKTVINKTLGKKTNMDKKRITGVEVANNSNKKVISVKLNADENLTNKMTRLGMLDDTSKTLKALSKFKNVSNYRIWWYYTMVDKYGNESEDVIMKVELTNKTLSKINWNNFMPENYPSIADFYWQHPSMPK